MSHVPLLFFLALWCGTLSLFTQVTPGERNQPSPSPGNQPHDGTSAQLLEAIKAQAMVVEIKATVGQPKEEDWIVTQNRVTVDGLNVSLKLEGADLLILADITPYRRPNDILLLLVQWQLWYRSAKDGQVYGRTSLKSATTAWGEPVYLYPLGQRSFDGKPAIILEIKIVPYLNVSPAPTVAADPGGSSSSVNE